MTLTKRRTAILLIALLALALGSFGYGARYGQCDMHSEFCAIGIAGTRSEVVVGWLGGLDIFAQTYPNN